MIERVARVIELAIIRHGVPESDIEGTLDDARAAIEAMPVAELREALIAARDFVNEGGGFPRKLADQIDAALNEEPKS